MLRRLFPEERCDGVNARRGGVEAEVAIVFLSYLCMVAFSSLAEIAFPVSVSPVPALLSTAAVALPILLFLRLSERNIKNALYLSRGALRPLYWLFLPAGAALFFLLCVLLLLLGVYRYGGASVGHLLGLPLLLIGYLVQGSAEELLCRGFFMSSLSARYGGRVSALVTSAFFALMHIFNSSLSALGLFNIFLFGMLFASVTQKAKSILPAALMHAGWNFSLSALGVQVSGNAPTNAVLHFECRIPFLGGGEFGPEASPLLTLALWGLLLLLGLCKGRTAEKSVL